MLKLLRYFSFRVFVSFFIIEVPHKHFMPNEHRQQPRCFNKLLPGIMNLLLLFFHFDFFKRGIGAFIIQVIGFYRLEKQVSKFHDCLDEVED